MPDQPNPSPYRSEPFRSYSRRVAHDLCEVPDLARIALATVGLLSCLKPYIAKEWPNTTEDDIPIPAFPTQREIEDMMTKLTNIAELWDVG